MAARRFNLPTPPPTPVRGWDHDDYTWPPIWLRLANREATEHFILLTEIGDWWCVYCGERANQADHLVPRPVSGDIMRRFVPTLPACQSCNGTLSDFHSPIVAARSAHIAMHLRRKHRIRNIEDLEREVAAAERDDFWERSALLHRLWHLEWGGLLRCVRDHYLPPPNTPTDELHRLADLV